MRLGQRFLEKIKGHTEAENIDSLNPLYNFYGFCGELKERAEAYSELDVANPLSNFVRKYVDLDKINVDATELEYSDQLENIPFAYKGEEYTLNMTNGTLYYNADFKAEENLNAYLFGCKSVIQNECYDMIKAVEQELEKQQRKAETGVDFDR